MATVTQTPAQTFERKTPKNLPLPDDVVLLGEKIRKETRRSSFTNVVEWLIAEKAEALGIKVKVEEVEAYRNERAAAR
jgi:hypothetical protein